MCAATASFSRNFSSRLSPTMRPPSVSIAKSQVQPIGSCDGLFGSMGPRDLGTGMVVMIRRVPEPVGAFPRRHRSIFKSRQGTSVSRQSQVSVTFKSRVDSKSRLAQVTSSTSRERCTGGVSAAAGSCGYGTLQLVLLCPANNHVMLNVTFLLAGLSCSSVG